jgi:hypothetical protein
MTPNECRKYENLPPHADGDTVHPPVTASPTRSYRHDQEEERVYVARR